MERGFGKTMVAKNKTLTAFSYYGIRLQDEMRVIPCLYLRSLCQLGVIPSGRYVYCFEFEKWEQITWEVVDPAWKNSFGLRPQTPEVEVELADQKAPENSSPLMPTEEEKQESWHFWSDWMSLYTPHFLHHMQGILQKTLSNSASHPQQIEAVPTNIDFSQVGDQLSEVVESKMKGLLDVVMSELHEISHKVEISQNSPPVDSSSDQLEFQKLLKEQESLLQKYNDVCQKLMMAKHKIRELMNYKKAYIELKNKSSRDNIENLSDHDQAPLELEDTQEVVDLAYQVKNQQEKEQLSGEYFQVELSNWYVKKMIPQGPYTFEEVLVAKERGEIDLESLVRKSEKELWKPVRDHVELCAPLKKVMENNGAGEEVAKYYVKRSSYRAPFYEVVQLNIGKNTYRGYCTSLSLGGLFIELNQINEEDMKLGQQGEVVFQKGTLADGMRTKVEVKNVHHSRPKGIGLAFVDLCRPDHKMVDQYVSFHLKNNSKKAA